MKHSLESRATLRERRNRCVQCTTAGERVMPKAKWDQLFYQLFRIIDALIGSTFAKAPTHQNSDAMNDEGTLKLQPSGLWAVCRPWRPPVQIESGNVFRVDVDGDLKLMQMGYRHFAGGGGEYYSVNGFKLRNGLRAAIGTGEDPVLYLRELVRKLSPRAEFAAARAAGRADRGPAARGRSNA
jgi:hypothetical protein